MKAIKNDLWNNVSSNSRQNSFQPILSLRATKILENYKGFKWMTIPRAKKREKWGGAGLAFGALIFTWANFQFKK